MQYAIVGNPVRHEIEGNQLLLRKEVNFEGDTRWVLSNTKGKILAEEKYPVETNEVMLERLYYQWQKSATTKYRVEIIERLTISSQYFEVEAKSEEEAQEKAFGLARNAEWSIKRTEYDVLGISLNQPKNES